MLYNCLLYSTGTGGFYFYFYFENVQKYFIKNSIYYINKQTFRLINKYSIWPVCVYHLIYTIYTIYILSFSWMFIVFFSFKYKKNYWYKTFTCSHISLYSVNKAILYILYICLPLYLYYMHT